MIAVRVSVCYLIMVKPAMLASPRPNLPDGDSFPDLCAPKDQHICGTDRFLKGRQSYPQFPHRVKRGKPSLEAAMAIIALAGASEPGGPSTCAAQGDLASDRAIQGAAHD
jgi:hypothetical protein